MFLRFRELTQEFGSQFAVPVSVWSCRSGAASLQLSRSFRQGSIGLSERRYTGSERRHTGNVPGLTFCMWLWMGNSAAGIPYPALTQASDAFWQGITLNLLSHPSLTTIRKASICTSRVEASQKASHPRGQKQQRLPANCKAQQRPRSTGTYAAAACLS